MTIQHETAPAARPRAAATGKVRRLGLTAVVLVSACTTVTYPGPRRPGHQVATLEGRDVAIDEVDGLILRGKTARLELLPGQRNLVIHLAWRRDIPGGSILISWRRRSEPVSICFTAVEGHTYVIEPVIENGAWTPFIADGASDKPAAACAPANPLPG
jgi:hypothetical protein